MIDRIGKGARSTPRDALIRDSTPPELMGASFGYHRGMDTVGAVIGPLIAVALLELGLSLREILWFAVVPGIATLVLLRAVREAPKAAPDRTAAAPSAEEVSALPASFWTVLAIWVVFSLGNSSDAFLLLRSHNLGLATVLVVLAYAVYNVVSASLSWPFGHLSDWIPRARIILAQGPQRRFTPYDRFAQFHESQGKTLAELVDEFSRLRAEGLTTLAGWGLTEPQLDLQGEHPEFGPVSLRQLLATWVAHDLGHVAQTARVMAKQYRDAVGPWRAYLPVLDR